MLQLKLATSNLKNGFRESNLNEKLFSTEVGLVRDYVNEMVKRAKQNGTIILEELKEKPCGQMVAYLRY